MTEIIEGEVWEGVVGYEGVYQVNKSGEVRSLDRVTCSDRKIKGKKLKCGVDKLGYKRFVLSRDGRTKTFMAHRLVALAFLDNPNNLPCINHKDENPSNNELENLEWCTHSYNSLYNNLSKRIAIKKHKPIYVIDDYSGIDYFFSSIKEAGETLGLNKTHISNCLNGRGLTHKGYRFEFFSKEVNVA